MKRLIIGVLIGFVLNTGLRALYSYSWWKSEGKFTNAQMNESFNKYKRFKCVEDDMGIVRFLEWPLVTPQYNFRIWEITRP